MGQLAQAAQNTELKAADPQQDWGHLISKNWERMAATLPSQMSSERFLQLAISTVNQVPKLAECTPVSVLSCLMKCTTLGLEPSAVDGLGRAYILPFYNGKTRQQEATFIIGYRGMLDLMERSNKIKSFSILAAYEEDGYQLTLDENGVPHLQAATVNFGATHKPEELQFVYLHVEYMNGGEHNAYMTRAEIEKVRASSKAGNSGPWKSHYEEMAKKTLIRREFKYMPVATEAAASVSVDETTPDYTGIFKPVIDGDTGEIIDE